MKHWTEDRIEKLEAVAVAARDILDLELTEEIPSSWLTEWLALQVAVAGLKGEAWALGRRASGEAGGEEKWPGSGRKS